MNALAVVEHEGQRVLTTGQLAQSFGTDGKRINDNFQNNRSRYTEGKHYHELKGDVLKLFKDAYPQFSGNLKFAPVLYLWTEKGAWMHAKSLNTDEAWNAYEQLVDDYYEVKSDEIDVSRLTPQMQMFHQMFNAVAKLELQASENDRKLNAVKKTVESIQQVFLIRNTDWRKSINSLLAGASYRSGTEHRDLRNQSYKLLEERAHCDLAARLRNLKQRLEDSGATKTQINDANKMDVIENDPRLKEIYINIVKELSIGTLKVTVQ